jgi:hypothetical protein
MILDYFLPLDNQKFEWISVKKMPKLPDFEEFFEQIAISRQ